MIILLSPAKKMAEGYSEGPFRVSHLFPTDTWMLAEVMKEKNPSDLKKLMSISDKLAEINYERFQSFSAEHSLDNSGAAILQFKGDVYVGLGAEDFSAEDLVFAEGHLRILSGLYGLLTPLTPIQHYRLEMGTSLSNTRGKNLYDFWSARITAALRRDMEKSADKLVVNLASNEYVKAIDFSDIDAPVVNVDFKEWRNGELRFISFNAKKARGLMTRYLITQRIETIEGIKAFDREGYSFDEEASSPGRFLFVR